MSLNEIQKDKLKSEIKYSASRSSGAGGQNVNKVNSKVELRFNILQSNILNESQKARLLNQLKNRINNNYEIILFAEEDRSQFKNKQIVTEKFLLLLDLALRTKKKRKPTKPTPRSKEQRLNKKKKQAEKKYYRGSIDY